MSKLITKPRGGDKYFPDALPKQPASPPIGVSERVPLWSSKYNLTFYGPDMADCERQLREMDEKRGGEVVRKRMKAQTTVVQ